jgi:hypothetical protein
MRQGTDEQLICSIFDITRHNYKASILQMISPLLRRIQSNINVYSGISPSLLATMSLSVNIRGNNHIELI